MTSEDYKATPEQWLLLERSGGVGLLAAESACLLELRARVQALEAAQQPTVKESLTVPPDPAGSLVERVAEGIAEADDEGLTNMTWNYHARAAIQAVAAWLRENDAKCEMGGDAAATADLLEQEAGQ